MTTFWCWVATEGDNPDLAEALAAGSAHPTYEHAAAAARERSQLYPVKVYKITEVAHFAKRVPK